MKSGALEGKYFACFVALLAATIPVMFTACAGGTLAPVGSSQTTNEPSIVSVVPDSAPPAGGTYVIINSSNFSFSAQQSNPSVSFGGVTAPQVTIISPIQVKAKVPSHPAGKVSVTLATTDGKSSTLTSAFTYTSASVSLKNVTPVSGPAAGGTTVTISGANFQPGVSVTFGGSAATSVALKDSTTLAAVTPEHSAGSTTLSVSNPDGQSSTLPSGFTFHSVDLMWNAPSSSSVTISGYNVYRGMSSAGPFGKLNGIAPLGSTSFTDPNVKGSTTYYYEVTSVGSNGAESTPAGPVQVAVSQ